MRRSDLGASPLATLVAYELRMLLRDRRTLFASVVLPILVMPFFLGIGNRVEKARQKRQEAATFSYAVAGGASEAARAWIAAFVPPPADEAEAAVSPDPRRAGRLTLVEKAVDDPDAALAAGELDLVVRALTPAEVAADPLAGEESAAADEGEGAAAAAGPEAPREAPRGVEAIEIPRWGDAGLPTLRLVYSGGDDASQAAAAEMGRRLEAVRGDRRAAALRERGFPVERDAVATLESEDVATVEQRSGAALGKAATVFVLMFLLIGGSVVAADTLAGEKERGTLETLLTTAATREEIVWGKQLVIVVVGVVITLIQAANLLVYVGLEVIQLPAGFRVDLPPATLVVVLLLFLPLAVLTSSLLLYVSGRAGSYREFQLVFFPLFLLCLLPALAVYLPGIDLRSAVVAVPIANVSVAVKEVLSGKLDLPFVGLAWLVSAAAAALVARGTARALVSERYLVAGERDRAEHLGGPELFERRAPRWFAVMWALILLASLNLPGLASAERQVLFNVVLVFFGGTLLMIRTYRLDPRQVLALRPPPARIWPAVVLAAPLGLVGTLWIAGLVARLLPSPERMMRQLVESLLPPDVPFWRLVVFLVLVPGICEEVAFRGALLHGLRRRLHPVALCLVVGAVFGLFHFQLGRLVPVTLLGVKLAALTLLTGSIYPAMLWHALNNLTAVLAERFGAAVGPDVFDPRVVAAAIAIEVVLWWWIWRSRRVYPGLKG